MLNILIGICLLLTQQHVAVQSQPPAQSTDQKLIETGIKLFSEHLVQTLAASQPDSNIIVSPINVYAALSLALLGSASETKDELVKALHLGFSDNDDVVHKQISGVIKEAQSSKYLNISIADAVFVNDKVKVSEEYQKNVKTYYSSLVESLNFSADDSKATDAINKWVSEQTHGGIPKLYEEKIDPSTVAILASALHFEAEWDSHFPNSMTKKGKFHGVSNEQEVDFMENLRVIPCYYHKMFSAIAISYKESEANFFIVLPEKNETLSNVIKIVKFDDIVSGLVNRYVDYTIPKLKLKYSNDLVDIIRKLGVEKAFDRSKADFSKLGVEAYIDRIVHKTELEVNEFGTIASAATSIDMFPMAMPISFVANRPFLFFIHHRKSNSIIFTGAIYNVQ